jgi:Family of unknown function (DUF6069)
VTGPALAAAGGTGGAGATGAQAPVAPKAERRGGPAMTAPLDQTRGRQTRAVDSARLWAGGTAAALAVGVIVPVGVLVSRAASVPRLAGDETGTLATSVLASYAVMWAVTTLLLTGVLHALLVLTAQPLRVFRWVACALVVLPVVAPFTAGGSRAAELAGALINLAAGGVAGLLLLRIGRVAVHASRRTVALVPSRPPRRVGQAGARRPRR